MQFNKIQEIREHKFIGNAHRDNDAFTAICDFADDDCLPIADRAEALRIMARKGMGLEGVDAGDDLDDMQLLMEYEISKV